MCVCVCVCVSLVPLVIRIHVMLLGLFTSSIQALILTTLVPAYIDEPMEVECALVGSSHTEKITVNLIRIK